MVSDKMAAVQNTFVIMTRDISDIERPSKVQPRVSVSIGPGPRVFITGHWPTNY